MSRFQLCFVMSFGLVGCPSPSPSNATGTVVDGTLTFSPVTDALNKFATVSEQSNGQPVPALEVFHEASIGTGECSMLALQDADTLGISGWEFAAPSGQTFQHVSINWSVYIDHRADSSTQAIAALLTDTQQLNLTVEDTAQTNTVTPSQIDDVIAGLDHFELVFALENPDYTSDLSRLFAQALRQCPGDAAPFSISATYE